MTQTEAIQARHSVRAYQDKKIEQEKLAQLNALIETCNQEGGLHLQLLEDAGGTFQRFLSRVMGLASAPSVIACVGPDEDSLDERIGYYGEKIVLAAQQMGLNTCWAGTFQKSTTPAQIAPGERLSIVIALGYGANSGRSRKSKTPAQVCPEWSENLPLWFRNGVEMALLAPTAVNQQKFEISLRGETPVITDKGGILSRVDLGIVKCHFEIGSGRKL